MAVRDNINLKKTKNIPIKHSPHYLALSGNPDAYKEYMKKTIKCASCNYKSLDMLRKLADKFDYLAEPFSYNYITVCPVDKERFLITDGLHRAAILCHKGMKQITVAVEG